VTGWTDYTVKTSLVDAVDTFSLRMPWTSEAWRLLAPDRPVRIILDGVAVVTGFLDESEIPPDDEVISVTGRDRCGRLVQESAPAIDYRGLGVKELVGRLASPWFQMVTLSNARNRRVLRGRGARAAVGSEPVRLDTRVGTRLEPGQMRWTAIDELLGQAGYLAWSAGDGSELVIGRPNYDQAVQFHFRRPTPGSRGGNVLGLGVRRSTADRYSRIIVLGSGAGTDASYGLAVSARAGEAKDNPLTVDGEGRDFSAPKRLVIADAAVSSRAEAQTRAQREMARRNAGALLLSIEAPGHGQVVAGSAPTLFCPDTLARVDDEVTGTSGVYLVVSCNYRGTRTGGATTSLELVPRGTELAG
jgi:prophage tail gpP-like protein